MTFLFWVKGVPGEQSWLLFLKKILTLPLFDIETVRIRKNRYIYIINVKYQNIGKVYVKNLSLRAWINIEFYPYSEFSDS